MSQGSRLRLQFERSGGQTVLADSCCQGSLRVIRPFLVDSTAVVQIIHVGPGLLAGDHFELDITLGPECKVLVTHQSATRIHSMPTGHSARQDVRLIVGDRARLDFLPGLNIPFRGASFHQSIDVQLARTCQLGLLESWAMGRIARNEYLDFQLLDSATSIRCCGDILYSDRLLLASGDSAAGLMENYRYYSSGYWFGLSLPGGIASPIEQKNPIMAFGPIQPGEAFFRCLAQDSDALQHAESSCLETVWRSRGERHLSLTRFRC